MLFRERGFSDVSVSEIMKATGLTHGAFYNHFASKDALIAESLAHASETSLADLAQAGQTREDMLAYLQRYLSTAHLDSPGQGCLIAALGCEIAREPLAREGFTTHIRTMITHLTGFLTRSSTRKARRDSIRMMASIVGAVMIARAVNDPELAEEILHEVRTSFE